MSKLGYDCSEFEKNVAPHVPLRYQDSEWTHVLFVHRFMGNIWSKQPAPVRNTSNAAVGKDGPGQEYITSPLVGRAHTRFLGVSPATCLEIVGPRGAFPPRFGHAAHAHYVYY